MPALSPSGTDKPPQQDSALMEALMRKPRMPETDEQRSDRVDRKAQIRIDDDAAADRALDAMVRQSIRQHGP